MRLDKSNPKGKMDNEMSMRAPNRTMTVYAFFYRRETGVDGLECEVCYEIRARCVDTAYEFEITYEDITRREVDTKEWLSLTVDETLIMASLAKESLDNIVYQQYLKDSLSFRVPWN